jgi:hypothetical protein
VLLDALEIGALAVAATHGPARAAREHRIHFGGAQGDPTRAADARGNGPIERVCERDFEAFDLSAFEAGVQAAHAAGNIEAHTPGRDDSALIRIERSYAADRESVAPVRVRHRIRSIDDAGQGGDVRDLLIDFHVHRADQRLVGVYDARHAHVAVWLDAPGEFG